jgi:hypothetical protein
VADAERHSEDDGERVPVVDAVRHSEGEGE